MVTTLVKKTLMLGLLAWAFVLSSAAPLWAQITQGPGGPILVLASSANPFGQYFAEILRAEGLNEFFVADISTATSSMLASYDVVLLGEMTLTSAQASLLTSYVNAGGNLIASRPDPQLAAMIGISRTGSTLKEGYLLVNTAVPPGTGIVNETMQYHGTADLYQLNGATSIATIYSSATAATSNPAVVMRSYGSGQAAAFVYDLAKSVVYTRQGNPLWAGQKREPTNSGGESISSELFYGPATFDPETNWVNLTKTHIPQADEQMRLLSNMILQMNARKKPLPRFWYMPFTKKMALILTSDDHNGGDTSNRYQLLANMSKAGCVVANWDCVRASSFIYPTSPITNATFASYQAQGFDTSLHTVLPESNSGPLIGSAISTQIAQFKAAFPSVNAPATVRAHGAPWPDWITEAVQDVTYGLRIDHTYVADPYAWYNGDPGFFTGSAMLMRFADINGTMYDIYQAPTEIYDNTGQTLPGWETPIFDHGVGTQGAYGFVTALIHADFSWQDVGATGVAADAVARGVAVISSRQALTWTDGRNNSSFTGMSWSGSQLSFTVTAATGSTGLQGMLPATASAGPLTSILLNGSPISFTVQTIKGISYGFFSAASGNYQAQYGSGALPPPVVTSTSPTGSSVAVTTSVSATFSHTMNAASFTSSTFTLRANGGGNVPATIGVSGSTATLTPSSALAGSTTYTATISGSVTDTNGVALGSTYSWSFTTAAGVTPFAVTAATPTGTSVSVNTTVTATFNRAVAPATFTTSSFTLIAAGGGSNVAATVSASGSAATLTPSAALTAGTTYTATILSSITDTNGVTLGSNYSWSFTTASSGGGGSPGGLVGYWSFNEGSGTVAGDSSGNGNQGSLVGAAWTAGYSGSGLSFSNGAFVNLNSPASLTDTSAFTWSAWAMATGEMGRGVGPIIEKGSGSSVNRTLSFGPATSSGPGIVFASVLTTGTGAYSATGTGSYSLNAWANWTATYDDAGDRKVHIYKNGVEVTYATQTAATGSLVSDAGAPMGFGATPAGQFFSFTGTLDEVRVYNRVLSVAEIQGLLSTGPTVTSASPTGSGVSVNTTVSANFSHVMNAASFSASTFTLLAAGASSNVPASVSVSGSTATLTPSSALAAGTTYTATILSSVTDSNGVALGSNYTWTFTTAQTPLSVTSATPTGTSVSVSTTVTATFNRAIAPATFTGSTFTLAAAGGGNVAATVSASGSTATLTPSAALAAGTTYTATISGSVTDTNGVALGSSYSWSFTTAGGGGGGGGVPTAGLVGYWSMNEGSGTVVGDTSGSGDPGTATGTSWTTGHLGSGLSFINGAVVTLGSPAPLTNMSAFSWSAWAMATSEMGRGFGPIIEKGSGSSVNRTLSFGPAGSSGPGIVFASVMTNGTSAYSAAATGTYSLNAWANWVATYDDAGDRKVHIYKNGVEVTYQTQTAATGTLVSDAGAPMGFGATPAGQFYSFSGNLDEVRVYNRALSLTEIQALAAQ